MKKCLITIILLFSAAVFYGHPPSGFDISFDAKKNLITAVITHDLAGSFVKDTAKHYIKTVNISVNDSPAIVQNFKDQEKLIGETVIYKLRLKKGDKVTVSGTCSLFGNASKDFVVP